MNEMKFQSLIAVILLSTFFWAGDISAGDIVKAKGMSFYEAGREAIAREKALDEAKRSAIEKAIGATVESRVAVENTQVIKDSIFSKSSGYLKNIEILEERTTNFGTYEITIQAEVEVSDMVSDLDRFKEALSWQKNPRVSVMVEPNTSKEFQAASAKAANMLMDKLKQSGFNVFKYTKADEAQMGLLVGITLEHSTKVAKMNDYDVTVNEISLSTNIYRPVDNEILAVSSAVKSIPGENRLQILDQATRNCITDIWKDLSKKITEAWEKELYTVRPINLIIFKVPDIASATQLASVFKSEVTGVAESSLLNFNAQKSEYAIKYKGWPDQFINEIQMTHFKNNFLDISLQTIAGNRVEAVCNLIPKRQAQ